MFVTASLSQWKVVGGEISAVGRPWRSIVIARVGLSQHPPLSVVLILPRLDRSCVGGVVSQRVPPGPFYTEDFEFSLGNCE